MKIFIKKYIFFSTLTLLLSLAVPADEMIMVPIALLSTYAGILLATLHEIEKKLKYIIALDTFVAILATLNIKIPGVLFMLIAQLYINLGFFLMYKYREKIYATFVVIILMILALVSAGLLFIGESI